VRSCGKLGRHKSPSPHRLQLLGEVVRIWQSKAVVKGFDGLKACCQSLQL
jgi:hypothetical protein